MKSSGAVSEMMGRDSSSDAMNTSFHIRKKKTVPVKEKS
jgi:hypothetical protein